MATLASTVIDRVVKHFQMGDSQEVLVSSLSDSVTTVTVIEDYRVDRGTILECEQELMFVTEWDKTNTIATVIRGWMGTTPATHAAETLILANPRIPRYTILDLVNECLITMYPKLFGVESETLTYLSATLGYALDADADKILHVMGRVDANSNNWKTLNDWDKQSDHDSSNFSTGQAIMIRTALPQSAPIRVTYTKPFVRLTAESDDLEAVGLLANYMTDLPYYFAMSRVMTGEEVNRVQSHKAVNHQRAQDVPGFLALRTGEWYKARYDDLVGVCYNRQVYETKKVMAQGYGG